MTGQKATSVEGVRLVGKESLVLESPRHHSGVGASDNQKIVPVSSPESTETAEGSGHNPRG